MVERWPNTYNELNGTYASAKLECVDAFAGLAQPQLQSPFVNELISLGATFAYMLNDPAGSAACADAAGRRIAAPVENSPYGVGSLVLGNSITANAAAGQFVGSPGPVATFNNNTTGPPYQNPETYVSIHKTTATPGPPASGGWTRIVHARASTTPPSGTNYTIWFTAPASPVSAVAFWLIPGGKIQLGISDQAGHSLSYTSAGSLCDGNWHQFVIAEDAAFNVTMYVDGAAVTPTGTAQTSSPGPCSTDTIGVYNIGGAARYSDGMVGDVMGACELPFAVTAAQVTNLYNSWRSASAGESSGARYARILRWLGWAGQTAIDTGSTSQMGPATDTAGQSGLNGLNLVAATENGDQYAAASGALTFKGRGALYGSRSPQVIFGEGRPVGNAGEWPCEIGAFDFDPSRIANSVAVTQYQGSTFTAVDATSKQKYFPRQYQRTVNTQLSTEAQNAATYLVSQLKNPRKRADVVRAHPSAIVGLFPVVAQIDKNARMRLIKRPIGTASTTVDGYVQRIVWTWQPDSNDVFVEYQASPADLQNYWTLAALHTTLNAQANSGQNHVTINALSDAAVNKLAQSLPAGYSLTFEPGTARAETIAIAPGGIPSTSVGYITATLTMASNFAFTHPAGSVVCERLPTGYTDPTTWDAGSVIGAAYATITPPANQGGLGGTQLPINALPDAAANAAILDWYPGQTLWISPGTANFQVQTLTAVSFTAPGWTSAILTFASLNPTWNFGDYICEPLPGGVTNPTALTPTARAAY